LRMQDLQALPSFLTVEEVAQLLRLKRSTAYEYVRQGIIPAIRFGSFIRIPRDRLIEMVGTHKETKGGAANF